MFGAMIVMTVAMDCLPLLTLSEPGVCCLAADVVALAQQDRVGRTRAVDLTGAAALLTLMAVSTAQTQTEHVTTAPVSNVPAVHHAVDAALHGTVDHTVIIGIFALLAMAAWLLGRRHLSGQVDLS